MKKSLFALMSMLFIFISLPNAQALSSITLTEPTHRALSGKFLDDELATALAKDGRLGSVVFGDTRGVRNWNIDAALVDEVIAMSAGYTLLSDQPGQGQDVATAWLSQLKRAVGFSSITATAYGSPSGYWIHRLSPHDESYFLSIGALHLQKFFGRPVNSPSSYASTTYFQLPSDVVQSYKDALAMVQATSAFMSSDELEANRLRIASIFYPELSAERRLTLSRDVDMASYTLSHMIKVSPGRFTVTSEHQKLPITIKNSFGAPASVRIYVNSLNERIGVTNPEPLILAANSKTEILVPVDVISSGDTGLEISVKTASGVSLGDSVIYPVSVRVISPIATWITTGAAITLFVAAIIQSGRRMRRVKK